MDNRFRLAPERLILHREHSLLISDATGRIGKGVEGFYYRQTRFLSRLALLVGGQAPRFASAVAVDSRSSIAYYLAPAPGDGEIALKAIEIQVNRFVGTGLRQEVILTNRGLAPAPVGVSIAVAADYADLSAAASGIDAEAVPVTRAWRTITAGGEIALRSRHPQLHHGTTIRIRCPGATLAVEDDAVRLDTTLSPQAALVMAITVAPVFQGAPIEPSGAGWSVGAGAAAAVPRVALSTPVPLVQEAWDRAIADLDSLALGEGEGGEQLMPAAGIPMFQAMFGRDALIAARQASLLSPSMLRGTLRAMVRWHADRYDDRYDAEPGKVIHQQQQSPLALLGRTPFLHYYGDHTAPGMFVIGAALDPLLTGDRDFITEIREHVRATLAWMDRDGDIDGDGFYEYRTKAGRAGIKNQGWKDSEQAILYPDGRPVDAPIAVAEIQGCYYAAKQAAGHLFLALGEAAFGRDLLDQAERLKRRFNEAFWLEDEQYFALALDPAKRPVRTIADNAGQCLAFGIVDAGRAEAVARRLMAPDLFSGWGIRTLSSRHPAYNPFVYHLGSVWPWDSATIAMGLKRYGFIDELHRLSRGLFDATRLFAGNRLPEVFGGHARDTAHPHPGGYPGANSPQAWSASAVVALILTLAGVIPAAALATVFVDPTLPDWLPEVTLAGIAVGPARVDLRFRRRDAETLVDIVGGSGTVRIERRPPLPRGTDRIAALLDRPWDR